MRRDVSYWLVSRSEVEPDLSADCAWCDVVCSAESGEEVVQGGLIGHVDNLDLRAPFVTVAVEEIVVVDSDVEKVSW